MRTVLGITGAILLLLLGGVVGNRLSPDRDRDAPKIAEPRTTLEDDFQRTDVRTEKGAVAAATLFSRVMAGVASDVSAFRRKVVALAAPEWRGRAEELANNTVDFVHEHYGRDGQMSFRPVRYRVLSFSHNEARVSIWGVVLGTGPKISGIEESWITATLGLVWTNSEWKVLNQSSEGGPTPESLRAEDDLSVDTILEGFKDYEDAPRR